MPAEGCVGTSMKHRAATILSIVSLSLAIVPTVFFVVVPVYSNGATLLEVNGMRAVPPLVFPVVLALLPTLIRKQGVRLIAGVLLAGFALVAGFTIGLFYIPAAVAMLIAGCVQETKSRRAD